jgi:hypothetical protein
MPCSSCSPGAYRSAILSPSGPNSSRAMLRIPVTPSADFHDITRLPDPLYACSSPKGLTPDNYLANLWLTTAARMDRSRRWASTGKVRDAAGEEEESRPALGIRRFRPPGRSLARCAAWRRIGERAGRPCPRCCTAGPGPAARERDDATVRHEHRDRPGCQTAAARHETGAARHRASPPRCPPLAGQAPNRSWASRPLPTRPARSPCLARRPALSHQPRRLPPRRQAGGRPTPSRAPGRRVTRRQETRRLPRRSRWRGG